MTGTTGRDGADIAVIGAGTAGLACAQALAASGRSVTVWEKSRGLGGRCATRRREGLAFDHGAPLAEVSTPAFAAEVAAWIDAGHAAPWEAMPAGTVVGVPGMSALALPMAAGLDIVTGAQVVRLGPGPGGWRLGFGDGRAEVDARQVVLAIPASQAIALLRETGVEVPGLDAVRFDPCWTVMAAFDAPLDIAEPVLADPGPVLLKALRDGAKPGHAHEPERWVLHARPEWTSARFDLAPEAAAAEIEAAFGVAAGLRLPEPRLRMVQRWRYAQVARPLGRPAVWDAGRGLGLAGDWCEGPGVEAAWTSGRRLAELIAAT